MKFKDMPYTRPDMEKVKEFFKETKEKVENANSAAEQIKIIEEFANFKKDLYTTIEIANIRLSIDTTDEFYENENNFFNEPIVLIEFLENVTDHDNRRSTSVYKKTYNPNLSQMGIYIDEDFIWQSLVEFLSNKRSEKEISPEVSNENKILSKGFDLKTSFRPNMKKKHKGDI